MQIYLKELNIRMVNKRYLDWMQDVELMRYTEQVKKIHTIKNIKKYVLKCKESKNDFLMGIFIEEKNKKIHVGNIKLGNINFKHKFAEISYFLGENKYSSRGIITSAISKIILLAKKKGIKKLLAGTYEMNVGSQQVLKKNNFKLEGVFKKKLIYKNKRCDHLIFGLKI